MTTSVSTPDECHICGSTRFRHLFDETPLPGYSFSLVRCEQCELIATSPVPSAEFLAKLYATGSYKENTVSGAYCLDENISGADFSSVLARLARMSSGRRLLDVGCGMGAFVKAALAAGWDSHGIEPSPYAANIGREALGDRIKVGFLDAAGYEPASFDVITVWYVLEHATDPSSILQDVQRLLKPGGVLFVSVPNARYIWLRRRLAQLRTGHPGTVHPQEHMFHYTSTTLRRLLEKNGFKANFEASASPYMVSGALMNFGKRVAHFLVTLLLRTTGISYGGILMFARSDTSNARISSSDATLARRP